jgi:hypothetical protein
MDPQKARSVEAGICSNQLKIGGIRDIGDDELFGRPGDFRVALGGIAEYSGVAPRLRASVDPERVAPRPMEGGGKPDYDIL